jgi:hypothetical protein
MNSAHPIINDITEIEIIENWTKQNARNQQGKIIPKCERNSFKQGNFYKGIKKTQKN